jgi:hypothetical protein
VLANFGAFVTLLDEIRSSRGLLLSRDESSRDDVLDGPDREHVKGILKVLRTAAKNGGLSTMFATTQHALAGIDRMTYRQAMERFTQLEENYTYDAERRRFWLIAEHKAEFFGSTFGGDVDIAFPDAAPEVREAHCCLAVARNTACVFHLMRAVEHAMRAIAMATGAPTSASVPLEYQEWNTVIEGIASRTERVADSIQV